MKAKILSMATIVSVGMMFWQCTETQPVVDTTNIQASLSEGSANINSAVKAITGARGYELINAEAYTSKSATMDAAADSAYQGKILLADIKGVYDYNPEFVAATMKHGPMYKYFRKSGESELFVVKFPSTKANPRKFEFNPKKDTALVNDFVFAASEYKYMWNKANDFTYSMKSDISIRDTTVSNLEIKNSITPPLKADFYTKYTMANGYGLEVAFTNGDTAVQTKKLTKDGKVIMEESFSAIFDFAAKTHQNSYTLKVGNVAVNYVRGTNTYTVVVDGVVQPNATVEVIARAVAGEEFSIFGRRNFQIKLEDGTVIKMAELLGDNISSLRAIFDGLKGAWFATNVVDWVAYNVYLTK